MNKLFFFLIIITIFCLKQLVDDIAKVLNFRGGRDGEGDVIHDEPMKRGTSQHEKPGYIPRISPEFQHWEGFKDKRVML